MATKYKFSDEELDTRLLELLAFNIPIDDFQKETLEKDEWLMLTQAIVLGRTFETINVHKYAHSSQLQHQHLLIQSQQ